MTQRWWRVGVIYEVEGEPFTQTVHVRAFTEQKARALTADAVDGRRHFVHVCHASDPLPHASRDEIVAATYGPYRRSWHDPNLAALRPLL